VGQGLLALVAKYQTAANQGDNTEQGDQV